MENKTRREIINHYCLMIMALVSIGFVLIYTKKILIPFVISVFIYFSLVPLMNFLKDKCHFPKWLSLGVILGICISGFSLLGLFVSHSISDFFIETSKYKSTIESFINEINQFLISKNIPFNMNNFKNELTSIPIASSIRQFSGGFFNLIGNIILVSIITLFLITGEEIKTNKFVNEIKTKISRYVFTKILVSLITAILIGAVLLFVGSDLVLLFALLTFIFNFIPSVGSIVATLLPVPVLFLQFGLGWKFAVVISLCGLIQFIIGNVIEPKIMGENLELHPISILLFLIFWGLIWGVPGMFLAVPITAVVKIIFSKIESTKEISNILEGRL